MRWIWIFLWVALSAIQLVLFVVNKWASSPPLTGSSGVGGDLVELARETNRGWNLEESLEDTKSKTDVREAFRRDGMERETWILRLSEMQQRLARNGVETRFMQDLEQWLSMHSRIDSGLHGESTIESYLSSVHDWLQPILANRMVGNLVLMRMEPGIDSIYPNLHFELNGIPEKMGGLLLQSSSVKSKWCLRELDLHRRDDLPTWWIQGTCAFMPDGNG